MGWKKEMRRHVGIVNLPVDDGQFPRLAGMWQATNSMIRGRTEKGHRGGVGYRFSVVDAREKGSDDTHGRSMIIETAFPPPRQRVARPRLAPRSFIA